MHSSVMLLMLCVSVATAQLDCFKGKCWNRSPRSGSYNLHLHMWWSNNQPVNYDYYSNPSPNIHSKSNHDYSSNQNPSVIYHPYREFYPGSHYFRYSDRSNRYNYNSEYFHNGYEQQQDEYLTPYSFNYYPQLGDLLGLDGKKPAKYIHRVYPKFVK